MRLEQRDQAGIFCPQPGQNVGFSASIVHGIVATIRSRRNKDDKRLT
jgi:hypothetical protein